MSGFSEGLALGLAKSLPNTVNNLFRLGPQIEQARQKGMQVGANVAYDQARTAHQLFQTEKDRRASNYWANRLGEGYANIDTTKGSNLQDAYLSNELMLQGDAIRDAYPLHANRDLVERMTSAGKPSFSEDAQATPPISAFGRKQPQMDARQAYNAVLNEADLLKRQALLSRGVAMTKGDDMHKAVGNTGYALDPFTGDMEISSTDLVNAFLAKMEADTSKSKAQAQKAIHDANRPYGRGGGGHGRGHGHRRSGGLGIDYREDRRNAVEAYRQASPEGKQQIKAAFRSKWGRNL